MKNQYDELLVKLLRRDVSKIEVANDDFLLFRDAWLRMKERDRIYGKVESKNFITYRYRW